MQHSKLMPEQTIFKSILTLAVPIIMANVLQSAYQLTDAFWVGRLGETAVASVSVSFPIIFLMFSLGTSFAIAGSTLIAQYTGAKNMKMVNHIAAQTMLMIITASLILGIIGYTLTPTLLQLMGVSPEVLSNATTFMRVSFMGLIFTFGFFMFQAIMRGIGQVKVPMYIVLGTVLLNFLLDPLFIFGFGPIPASGVSGAALATISTQCLATLVAFYVLFKGKHIIHLKLSDFVPDFKMMKRTFMLGLPASIEMSARSLGIIIMTFLITSFGTMAIASYGVGSNILQFIIIIGIGIAMSTATLVGQSIGANRIALAEKITRISALVTFVIMSAMGIITFIFASSLIAFFIPNEPAVIAEGAKFLKIMSLTFGFMGMQFAFVGTLRGAGNMVTTMVIGIVSQWVLQFPLAYILSSHTSWGLQGLWWSFPITNVIMALITFLIFMKGDWKKSNLTREDELVKQVTQETIIEETVR